MKFYALQIARHVRGMWLVDLRKREFRALRPYLARLGIDLIILQARQFKINPLQVPRDVVPADWVPRVSDMLIQVLDLPPRASKLLQTTLFRLYRKFGILDGARRYPTLFDLHEDIKADRDANRPAQMAVLDSLAPVLYSLGPEVLAYRYGWTSGDLSRMHMAIELAGSGEREKNLIINTLVLSEFTSRVARGISNPKMDLWICVDEAQRLCCVPAAGQSNGVSDLIGLVRGAGVGLDLSVLSTSNLAPQVPSNTAIKVLGRCGSAADYAAAGHNIGLSAEQIQWAQLHLRPGLFIGQLGEGEWRHPFVFTIPAMDLSDAAREGPETDGIGPLKALPTEKQPS